MSNFICVQCGTQFSVTAAPPETCPICTDARQYVRHEGQAWTTMEQLAADHHNRFEEEAGQLLGIGTEPNFAIGQRALLLQLPRQWVMQDSPRIRFWNGSTQPLWDELTLINCGGHFDGGTVLHWAGGAESKGALLSGDIIQVVPDRRYVTFMWSYPNLVPLGAAAIRRIVNTLQPFHFDRIYGAWWKANITSNAKLSVATSAERYLHAISS